MTEAISHWALAIAGCGTAGLAVARTLMPAVAFRLPRRILLADKDSIDVHNGLTCPEYAGRAGEAKVDRLARLVRRWCSPACPVVATHLAEVESLDWIGWLTESRWQPPVEMAVVVLALDDYQSRLCLVEDLRHAVERSGVVLTMVEVGLDRNQAMVSVLGSRWKDACPACGLAYLPQPEACVELDRAGRSRRGDLQRESGAAAELVRRIVLDALAGRRAPWCNTKNTLMTIAPDSDEFECSTWARARVAGCLGPHSPATPICWDRLQDKLAFEEVLR